MSKPIVLVITGPTASGKTKIAIDCALKLNGEIISADSMQVYKHMDIGTAKPSEREKEGVKHYLIDEVYPNEEFNVSIFKERAEMYVEKILKKGKLPVIVGGTGLYLSSLVNNIKFSEADYDWEFRNSLHEEAEEFGNEHLHNRLKELDSKVAEEIHPNNVKKVVRAIEIIEKTDKSIAEIREESISEPVKYEYMQFCIDMDREEVYDRINRRVDIMFDRGLVDEVKELIHLGCSPDSVAMQGIGYKEVVKYLMGGLSLGDVKYIIKRDTRHYAKRQLTWFRKMENLKYVSGYDEIIEDMENVRVRLDSFLAERGYYTSRERAKNNIINGSVMVNKKVVTKSAQKISLTDTIVAEEDVLAFVSRGALKMEKAIADFAIDMHDKVCMDVGASTGGFTECMLNYGASKVYAIDVGTDQLDEKLKADNRVLSFEHTDIRKFDKNLLVDSIDFVSIDVSFISLTRVLQPVYDLVSNAHLVMCLIKPQFEVGKDNVGKNGIVRDESIRQEAVNKVVSFAESIGYIVKGLELSPIEEKGVNTEYLCLLERG